MTYAINLVDARAGRSALLDLWRRNLPSATPERFAWLYEDGPAQAWLAQAQSAGGQPIGAAGLMTRRLLVNSMPCLAGQAIDLNVDRERRTMGLALQLQRVLLESLPDRDVAFVYAMPGQQAAAILRRVGYREVGPINHWTKPLSAEYKLRRWIRPRLPAKMAAWLVAPWLHWRYGERPQRPAADCQPAELPRFDERFDALWHSAAARFSVLGERSAAFLSWRFERFPGGVFRIFGLMRPPDHLAGYAVYRQDPGGSVYVSDFLFDDAATCSRLLTAFIHKMRQERMQAIHLTFLGPVWVEAALADLGFRQRSTLDQLLVYPGAGSDNIVDRNRWFFTRADLDVEG